VQQKSAGRGDFDGWPLWKKWHGGARIVTPNLQFIGGSQGRAAL
jgi:hypothetical protein